MRTHPEQEPDEVYLGNTTIEGVMRSSWRTSRLGEYPLCADGSPYKGTDLRPWFIKRSEVQGEINKLKGWIFAPDRDRRIKKLESML
jgi:hypothetical protein